MTDRRVRYLSSAGYSTPLPRPVELLSQEEMVRRIEAARLEDAPESCQTCGSTARLPDRVCPHCDERKPIAQFHRNRTKPGGRNYWCAACVLRSHRARRVRQAIAAAGGAA